MPLPLIGAVGRAAESLFGAIDKLVPDRDLAQKLQRETEQTLASLNLAQMQVNAEEARHKSLFVAGWRPFIGWVCGAALAWEFVLAPLANWGLTLAGLELVYSVPDVVSGKLFELVLAMLGMAGLRTYEKQRGVSR